MTAEEARTIMNEMDPASKSIRDDIDRSILESAKGGNNYLNVTFYRKHSQDKVVKALLKDGFKAKCDYGYDNHAGGWYTYKISW